MAHRKCGDESRIIDLNTASIEHIYSQNAHTKVAPLAQLINDLGNLTLISSKENEQLANKDIAAKRPVFKKSSLAMNRAIAEASSWGVKEVEDRRTELLDQAVRVFSM